MSGDLRFDVAAGFSWPPQNQDFLQLGIVGVIGVASSGHPVVFPKEAARAELVPVIASFNANIGGIQSMLTLPRTVFSFAQRAERLALHVQAGQEGAPDEQQPTPDQSPEVLGGALENQMKQKAEYERLLPDLWADRTRFGDLSGRQFGQYYTDLPRMWSGPSTGLSAGFENLLRASLLNAWTAFEVLATDLWVAAVDLRPRTLARNVVLGPKPGRRAPQLSFSDLADYGFDLRTNMGKLLKDYKKVRTESLAGLRDAYLQTFLNPGDKERRPSNTLDKLLEKHFPSLKCFESVRNLLAHRGGVVDAQFRDEVKEYSAELHGLPLAAPLPVDGEMVRDTVKLVIDFSLGLLGFVGLVARDASGIADQTRKPQHPAHPAGYSRRPADPRGRPRRPPCRGYPPRPVPAYFRNRSPSSPSPLWGRLSPAAPSPSASPTPRSSSPADDLAEGVGLGWFRRRCPV